MTGPVVIDNSNGTLRPEVRALLEQMAASHADIVKIIAMPNVSSSSDQSVLPSGVVTVVKADAPLHPALIPSRLHSVLTVYELSSKDGSDLTEQSFPADLSGIVGELLGDGPSLKHVHVGHCDPALAGRDKSSWTPSLGERGWLSISKYQPRHIDSTFYLCIFNSNDTLSRELVQLADNLSLQTDAHSIEGRNAPVKFETFIALKQYGFAKHLARRNNDRIALALAERLGLRVNRSRDDVDGLMDVRTQHYDRIAVPDVVTYYGQIAPKQYNDDDGVRKDALVIYDRCSDVVSSLQACAVPLSPIEGVVLLEGMASSPLISAKPSCLPFGVGHENGHRALDSAEKKYVGASVHWAGKRAQQLHAKTTRNYRSVETVLASFNKDTVRQRKLVHVAVVLHDQ